MKNTSHIKHLKSLSYVFSNFHYPVILILLIFQFSCSPVRTGNYSRNNTKQNYLSKITLKDSLITTNDKDTLILANENETLAVKKANIRQLKNGRFSDTLSLLLPASEPKENSIFSDEFDEAVISFERNEFSQCEPIFRKITETVSPEFYLYYEAKMYLAESLMAMGNLVESAVLMQELLNSKNVPNFVKEKALLQLGKIKCSAGRKSEAEKFFSRLKDEFPKSELLPLAVCN